ncbi:MAG: hypothetical protein V4585_16915 [Bacteroidota bacterium]
MKQSILLSLALGVLLFACQTNDSLTPASTASSKGARTAAIVYSNDFEATPIGWSVYVWSWSTGYATLYSGSKRLDQANLLATVRPKTYLVKYQTTSAIAFPGAGNYKMTYTTITTATSIANSGIQVILVDAFTGVETLIDTVPLMATATPLTTRTASFTIPTGGTSQFLKIVSKANETTTSPTLAGHCYFDNIVIQ